MLGSNEITNSEDIIDSREIIERIKYLEDNKESLSDDDKALNGYFRAELRALKNLADQCTGYASDWEHGLTLVRDSYFKEYAQQMAEDIGAIKNDISWPYSCIDWDQAADELKQDYTSVDFDGVDYWVR